MGKAMKKELLNKKESACRADILKRVKKLSNHSTIGGEIVFARPGMMIPAAEGLSGSWETCLMVMTINIFSAVFREP